jgi:small-conductance mechanosensitive channel
VGGSQMPNLFRQFQLHTFLRLQPRNEKKNTYLTRLEKREIGDNMENQEKEITIIGAREPMRQTTTEVVEPKAEEMKKEEVTEQDTPASENPDDFLLSQIDEFRVKAQQLQELLRAKENKARELQQLVNERTDKAEELQQIVNERQEKADGITAEVARQIKGMTEKVDDQLDSVSRTISDQVETHLASINQTVNSRLDQVDQATAKFDSVEASLEKLHEENVAAGRKAQETDRTISEMSGQLQEVREAAEKLDTIKADISDKIHTESVQSYRNTQELIRAMDEKLNKINTIEKGVHSVKNMSAAIVVLTVIDLLGVAAAVVLSLGLF